MQETDLNLNLSWLLTGLSFSHVAYYDLLILRNYLPHLQLRLRFLFLLYDALLDFILVLVLLLSTTPTSPLRLLSPHHGILLFGRRVCAGA